MKLTSVHNIRHLISKLHPPLPASPRESKQLESILRSSFKKRLDEAHPAPQVNHDVDVPIVSPQPARSESAEATNIHLQSVLGHPSLGRRTLTATRESSFLSGLLEAWDEAVLQNKLDLPSIVKYVKAHQSHVRTSPENASQLATRIKNWFATTSNTQREKFLAEADLIRRIMPMMYLAKMEEEVWGWLRLLYSGQLRVNNPDSRYNLQSESWLRVEDTFICRMMEQSLRANDCSGAAQQYIQACIYRTQTGRRYQLQSGVSAWAPTLKLPYAALQRSWRVLSTAIVRQRYSHGMSSTLYDQMMGWRPAAEYHWFDDSFLHLYRPSAPSAKLLSQLIQKPKWITTFARFLEQRASNNLKYHLLMSVFDAAELELEAGRPVSAKAFLKFAEDQFHEFVSFEKEASPAESVRSGREQVTHISMPQLEFG